MKISKRQIYIIGWIVFVVVLFFTVKQCHSQNSKSLILDGTTDWINFGDQDSLDYYHSTAWTDAMWVMPLRNSADERLWSKYGAIPRFRMSFTNAQIFSFQGNYAAGSSWSTSSAVQTINRWYLVTYSYNPLDYAGAGGFRLRVYSQTTGSLVEVRGNDNTWGTQSFTAGNFILGAELATGTAPLKGIIAQYGRWYKDTLTTAEITELCQGVFNWRKDLGDYISSDNLTLFIPIEEGSGTSIYDQIQGYTGAFVGTPAWTDSVPTTHPQTVYYIDSLSGNDNNSGYQLSQALATFDSISTAGVALTSGDTIAIRTGFDYSDLISLTLPINTLVILPYDSAATVLFGCDAEGTPPVLDTLDVNSKTGITLNSNINVSVVVDTGAGWTLETCSVYGPPDTTIGGGVSKQFLSRSAFKTFLTREGTVIDSALVDSILYQPVYYTTP